MKRKILPTTLSNLLNIDVEAVEATRIRLRDFIGKTNFDPELVYDVPGYTARVWWMVNSESFHTINELLMDLFPEGKGFVPAAGDEEVTELFLSARKGPDEFLAHVERARTFLEWRGHKKPLPFKRSSCAYKRQDYGVLSDTMQAIASALEKHWIPLQPVSIEEMRCGVYSISLDWRTWGNSPDIIDYFPSSYLTDDGFYAANSRSEVIRMLLSSLHDEDQFFDYVELSAVSLALLEGMNEDRAD